MRRRNVVLGVAAVAAVAAAVTVTIANRHRSSPQHDAVARYVKAVDLVEQQMRLSLTQTFTAFRSFAKQGSKDPAAGPRLARAERTLVTLQRRLAALSAPPPAKHLRALLLRLVKQERATAEEVRTLAAFTPRFDALLNESRAASATLSRRLAAVKPPQPRRIRGTRAQVRKAQAAFAGEAARSAALQADAVDAYDAAIGNLQRRLARLRAPAVMEPAALTQMRTFEASRRAGAALAHELRQRVRPDVAVLGRRFTLAARSARSVGAQKAEIAAIRAYNQRVRAIGTIGTSIQREFGRLQRSFG